jgi:hypothetical protein
VHAVLLGLGLLLHCPLLLVLLPPLCLLSGKLCPFQFFFLGFFFALPHFLEARCLLHALHLGFRTLLLGPLLGLGTLLGSLLGTVSLNLLSKMLLSTLALCLILRSLDLSSTGKVGDRNALGLGKGRLAMRSNSKLSI